MAVDLSVFGKLKTKADFDREAEAWALAKAEKQSGLLSSRVAREAEMRKNMYPDVDKLGEVAFFKAAQGMELTPQERAAAMYVDAKSGGIMFNPATGDVTQKPRISDKIGIGGFQNQPPRQPVSGAGPERLSMSDLPGIQPMNPTSLSDGPTPRNNLPIPPKRNNLTTKGNVELEKSAIESAQKRVDELNAQADASQGGASAANRMKELLPNIGYTGFGGNTLAALDKGLSGVGIDIIKGDPGAREQFQTEGTDAWVKAVTPLKGALSNTEGNRFDKALSNLTTTKAGIELRARVAQVMAQRANEKSQFYQDWFSQNGNLNGADRIWNDYAEKNQLLTQDVINGPKKINPSNIPMDAVKELRAAIKSGDTAAIQEFEQHFGQGSANMVMKNGK